jgi:hypothetical protein
MPPTLLGWLLSMLGNLLLASPLAPVVQSLGVSLPEQFALTTGDIAAFVGEFWAFTGLWMAHCIVLFALINAVRLVQYANGRYQEVTA